MALPLQKKKFLKNTYMHHLKDKNQKYLQEKSSCFPFRQMEKRKRKR